MAKQGSRLTRTLEHQSKKQLYIFLAATIFLIAILGIFSTQILDTIGRIMIGSDRQNEVSNEESIEAVTPPRFTSIPEATETGTITISGSVSKENGTIEVFVNNRKLVTKNIKDGTSFNLPNVQVSEGENLVKAKYILNDRESSFTKDYRVFYTKDGPKIDISHPEDGREFKRGDQKIEVRGSTQPRNTVTINGFRAVVDENGEFTYHLSLNEGDNTISITAVSLTGKETTKEIKVTYQP